MIKLQSELDQFCINAPLNNIRYHSPHLVIFKSTSIVLWRFFAFIFKGISSTFPTCSLMAITSLLLIVSSLQIFIATRYHITLLPIIHSFSKIIYNLFRQYEHFDAIQGQQYSWNYNKNINGWIIREFFPCRKHFVIGINDELEN
jgi:hypothetical protein